MPARGGTSKAPNQRTRSSKSAKSGSSKEKGNVAPDNESKQSKRKSKGQKEDNFASEPTPQKRVKTGVREKLRLLLQMMMISWKWR